MQVHGTLSTQSRGAREYLSDMSQLAAPCAVVMLLRLGVLVMHLAAISKEASVNSYLPAPATIWVEAAQRGATTRDVSKEAIVSYTYAIDGVLYESDRYSIMFARQRPNVPRPTPPKVREIVGTAYYNPAWPASAVLQKDLSAFPPLFFGAAGAFAGAGLLFLASLIHRMTNAESGSHAQLGLSGEPSSQDVRRWTTAARAMLVVDIGCTSLQVVGMWLLLAMSGLRWTGGALVSLVCGTAILAFTASLSLHRLLPDVRRGVQ